MKNKKLFKEISKTQPEQLLTNFVNRVSERHNVTNKDDFKRLLFSVFKEYRDTFYTSEGYIDERKIKIDLLLRSKKEKSKVSFYPKGSQDVKNLTPFEACPEQYAFEFKLYQCDKQEISKSILKLLEFKSLQFKYSKYTYCYFTILDYYFLHPSLYQIFPREVGKTKKMNITVIKKDLPDEWLKLGEKEEQKEFQIKKIFSKEFEPKFVEVYEILSS